MDSFAVFLEQRGRTYKFSSLQYDLPESVAKEVLAYGKEYVPDRDLGEKGREDEVHCTVLYGIHDKSSGNVRRVVRGVEPFYAELGGVSAFTINPDFDVLKIDVTGDGLHRLNRLLRKKLDVTTTHPEYKPHVTVAYLKKGAAAELVDDDRFRGTRFLIDRLTFSSTAGTKSVVRLV